MDVTRMMNMTATLLTRTTGTDTDDYGNPILVDAQTVTNCYLYQTMRSEQDQGRQVGEESWTLYLPPGTAIGVADAVIANGATYEVVGPAWHAVNPRTLEEAYVVASLHRTA